jgi:hypothetical protein
MRLGAQEPRLAVGLTRVSTAEQGQSGLGLEAQQASIRSFVATQGWTLVAEFSDIASGKDDRRPGFQAALARCWQLDAVLVAARLDRITRRAHGRAQTVRVAVEACDGWSKRCRVRSRSAGMQNLSRAYRTGLDTSRTR